MTFLFLSDTTMDDSIQAFKLKIFDAYLSDTGSSYEGFLSDKKLTGASDDDITKAKLQIIDEAIEIMGKDDLFKNYLSDSDYLIFKEKGY